MAVIKIIASNEERHGELRDMLAGSDYRVALHGGVESSDPHVADLFDLLVVEEDDAVAGCLNALKDHPAVPVLAIVDSAGVSDNVFTETGADDILARPFSRGEFLARIARVLRESVRYNQLLRYQQDLEHVIDMSSRAATIQDPRRILGFLVKELADIIPVDRCSILRVDQRQGRAVVVSSHDDAVSHEVTTGAGDIVIDLDKHPEIREASAKQKTVFIRDVSHDPVVESVREVLAAKDIASILVMPITHRDKTVNQLYLRASRSRHFFDDTDIRLSRSVADASAGALYWAMLAEKLDNENRKLQRLALTDPLTGLYNIRYFNKRLEQEFSRSLRHGQPLSCMMFDLDNFKDINDTFGHKHGDRALVEFAKVLERNFRKSDIVSRYGGDEFIVLMPQSESEGALSEAERIRDIVEHHGFMIAGKRVSLSASIGFASFPSDKMKVASDLVACADKALLQAKVRGRNIVAVFDRAC
ncbi:MAG: diguanylate cyclase [Nitrospirae bacterium]|nr:diguanylate cyclase [Nitrospirota bacterium]